MLFIVSEYPICINQFIRSGHSDDGYPSVMTFFAHKCIFLSIIIISYCYFFTHLIFLEIVSSISDSKLKDIYRSHIFFLPGIILALIKVNDTEEGHDEQERKKD